MVFEIYQIGKSNFQSNKKEAFELNSKSSFGESKEGKIIYSVYEVLYLIEKRQVKLLKNNKEIKFSELLKKADSALYEVFKDLRDKGNILKEGLKFGADFRVYEKGDKPGKAHAKYLLFIVNGKNINTLAFAAKARIAHSTKKILLLAIVDGEGDVSYYETNWKSKE